MHTRAIGDSDLEVSAIGLGAMPLSISGRPDEDRAREVIRTALGVGVTLIDTADVYGIDGSEIGHNERLIARVLRELGRHHGSERVLVATKGGLIPGTTAWRICGRPDHLHQACDRSLAALGVEVIDLYQLHAPDRNVPLAETMGALAQLRQAGKIRHVGLSNVTVDEIELARKTVPVISVQNCCNVFDTMSFEHGVVEYCDREGIAFLPYAPVGGHRYGPEGVYRGHARTLAHEGLDRLAARAGATSYELMIAWLLTWSPMMLPIPGASRPQSIISSARATGIELDAETRAGLDAIAGVPRKE